MKQHSKHVYKDFCIGVVLVVPTHFRMTVIEKAFLFVKMFECGFQAQICALAIWHA